MLVRNREFTFYRLDKAHVKIEKVKLQNENGEEYEKETREVVIPKESVILRMLRACDVEPFACAAVSLRILSAKDAGIDSAAANEILAECRAAFPASDQRYFAVNISFGSGKKVSAESATEKYFTFPDNIQFETEEEELVLVNAYRENMKEGNKVVDFVQKNPTLKAGFTPADSSESD